MMNNKVNQVELPYLVRFPDFVLDQSGPRKDAERVSHSKEHWYYALDQIRKRLYTNTSATVDAPFDYMLKYETKVNGPNANPHYYQLVTEIKKAANTYAFNSQPFGSDDIFMYRHLRSEHLLTRMAHTINVQEMTYSFSRLSRGIFLVQKYEPSDPIDFPSRYMFDQSFAIEEAAVDTFTFDILLNDMVRQTQATKEKERLAATFIPFTYTLGVRYTNPYQNASDVVVRGNIPLWCQTLLITEYMRKLPILPDTAVTGLLPFLKDMEFRFKRITAKKDGYPDPHPQMTLLFERFAMELSDPQMLWQNEDDRGNTWADTQERILNTILFCDIPDEQAAYITLTANEWARSQGIQ